MAALAALPAIISGASTALQAIGTIASIGSTAAGTFIAARAAQQQGRAAQIAAEHEAAQLDIKAKEEQTAAQREAFELRRRKDLALSELQAKGAASGFSATDPTSLALADEIARYGTMQEQMAMYGGASRRAGLEGQAEASLFEGRMKKLASKYDAAATIAGGTSSIANKFAKLPSIFSSASAPASYGSAPLTGWTAKVTYG